MTALAKAKIRKTETWKLKSFTLPIAYVAYQGGVAALETTAGATQGKVIPGATSTTLFVIGTFAETVDATSASKSVIVDLGREIEVEWYANSAATDDVKVTDIGQLCYIVDDQTVMITSSGKSVAGRVWGFDATKGVAVERLVATQMAGATGNIAASAVTAGTAYQVLRTNAGATASEWGRVKFPWAVVNATNDVTITIAQGNFRQITACGDTKAITLSTSGAVAGDFIEVYRAALGATTGCTVVNGGVGVGTLQTMTSNKAAAGKFIFDGTNWAASTIYQAA
jgi:hypothetical protein